MTKKKNNPSISHYITSQYNYLRYHRYHQLQVFRIDHIFLVSHSILMDAIKYFRVNYFPFIIQC